MKQKWESKPFILERWEYAREDRDKAWSKNARNAYYLYDGTGHWTSGEVKKLEAEHRPITVINMIFKFINVLVGNEIQNRNEIHVFPMENGDVQMANILNYMYKYLKSQNNLDWELSQANLDGYLTGVGWMKNFIDVRYKYDRKGNIEGVDSDIKCKHVNPLSVYFDPDSIELDLSDCQDIHEVVKVPRSKLIAEYPKLEKDIDAFYNAHQIDNHGLYVDEKKELCTIIYSEYKDHEKKPYWLVEETGDLLFENPKDGSKKYHASMPVVKGVKHFGDIVLEDDITDPYACGMNQFSYSLACPYFVKGRGVSVVEQVRSLQEIIDKSYSQALDILNRQPKAGGLVQKGAADPEKLQEMARSGNWVEVEDLKGILPNERPDLPTAYLDMVKYGIDLGKEILGTPEVFLGEAPGRIESGLGVQILRKQSGLSFEHPADNVRHTQIQIGRKFLNQIREFWSANKVIRLMGEDGNLVDIQVKPDRIMKQNMNPKTGEVMGGADQIAPLMNKLNEGDYDFIIDVNEPSITQRMYNQTIALQLFQMLSVPELIPPFMDMLDFPNKEKWKEALTQAMQKQMAQAQGGGAPPPAKPPTGRGVEGV